MISKTLYICLLIFIFACASQYALKRHELNIQKTFKGSDIEAIWQEGTKICKVENPYSRIKSNAKNSHYKPPTYFPGFYALSCSLQKFFPSAHHLSGIEAWSVINSALYLLSGLVFLYLFIREENYLPALCALVVFFFSRWTFQTMASLQQNLLAIFLLILAFAVFKKKPLLACFLLSLSLIIKQIAIFLIPLFLILELRDKKDLYFRLLVISALPIIFLLPFIINDFEGVFYSIFYSAARETGGDRLFSSGLRTLLMFFSMAVVYFAALRKQVSLELGSLLIMLTFVGLHSVFFTQYYFWLMIIFLVYFAKSFSVRNLEP